MKTVVLLRHADIDPPPGPAPDTWELNALGKERAAALARVLGSAGVAAVFASPALRTQQTVKPLAENLGLEVLVRPALSQLVQEALAGAASGVVVIAGHSNTVPQLITALSVPPPAPAVQGFDNLFVVTVAAPGQAGLLRLKYGAPGS